MTFQYVLNPRLARVLGRWESAGIESSPEPFLAVGAVIRLNGYLRRFLDECLEPEGLTRTTFMLMTSLLLAPDGGHKMSDLSHELMVRPTTVTVLVDQLAERKLVRRTPHPTDRRANLISLTPRGRQLTLRVIGSIGGEAWGLGSAEQAEELLMPLLAALRNFNDPVAAIVFDGEVPTGAAAGASSSKSALSE